MIIEIEYFIIHKYMEYTFQADVRIRNHGKAKTLWYFITVPKIYSDDITKYGGLQPRK